MGTHLVGGPELLDGHLCEQGFHQRDDHRRADEVGFHVEYPQGVIAFDRGRQQQGSAIGQADVGQREDFQVGVALQGLEHLLVLLVGNGLEVRKNRESDELW